MDARHEAGHDGQEIRPLTAFRFVTIFLSAFPAEGRIHEASLVRGKGRRSLSCLVNTIPGRSRSPSAGMKDPLPQWAGRRTEPGGENPLAQELQSAPKAGSFCVSRRCQIVWR